MIFKNSEWGRGFMRYASGESFERCENAAQLDGWLAAAQGHVAGELGEEGENIIKLLEHVKTLVKPQVGK